MLNCDRYRSNPGRSLESSAWTAKFFMKGQIINISGFGGLIASVTTTNSAAVV